MERSIMDKVVLITGCSSGLGKELAELLLTHQAKVAATFRSTEQAQQFEQQYAGQGIGIVMDITVPQQVTEGVKRVLDVFGRIDILANNAGVGGIGAVEETSDEETRRLFEINFFGGLALIRAVLPTMRYQPYAHILLFSAIGGFHGVPGFGLYASAKGATIILGESLAAELKPFNIDVTVLTIGVFDTGMATRLLFAEKEMDEYQNTPAAHFRGFIKDIPGKEPNDPQKAAVAILNILKSEQPPVHAALGSDALAGMRKKFKDLEMELNAWEANARSTTKDH